MQRDVIRIEVPGSSTAGAKRRSSKVACVLSNANVGACGEVDGRYALIVPSVGC